MEASLCSHISVLLDDMHKQGLGRSLSPSGGGADLLRQTLCRAAGRGGYVARTTRRSIRPDAVDLRTFRASRSVRNSRMSETNLTWEIYYEDTPSEEARALMSDSLPVRIRKFSGDYSERYILTAGSDRAKVTLPLNLGYNIRQAIESFESLICRGKQRESIN